MKILRLLMHSGVFRGVNPQLQHYWQQYIIHDWLLHLDREKEICCVYLDFCKAFNTVPHCHLLQKLEKLNLHPLLVQWTCSYRTECKQHVVVNGTESDFIPVVSGVPQGSVLGPLLFLIYIDGLAKLPLSTHSKISLYADDVLLYKPIECGNDIVEFQCDINKISQWTSANHMTFNTNKCKCMMLSKK